MADDNGILRADAEKIIADAGPWVSAVSDQETGGFRHVSVVFVGNKSPEEIARLEMALRHFKYDGPNSEYSSHLARPDSEIRHGLEFNGTTKTLAIETFVPSDGGMAKVQALHQSLKSNGGSLYEWSDDSREWTNQHPENGPKHMRMEEFAAKPVTTQKIDFVEDLRQRFGMETTRDVVQALKQNGLPLPVSREEYQVENGVLRMHAASHGVDVVISGRTGGAGLPTISVAELDAAGTPLVRPDDRFYAGNAEISIEKPVVRPVVQPLPETPSLLYRVTQREVKGALPIDPRLANDLDPEPYVYASSKLQEVLPYLAKNGTRIVNEALPGSDDFITILPDREDFLKNKKFGGTIVGFSGEGFEKSPRKESQWISRKGIVVSEQHVVDRVDSMEAAMRHGLHVLFTTKPMTPENRSVIDAIIQDPGFPHNLPKHIADGTLIYENAVRAVNPSSFLMGEPSAKKPMVQPLPETQFVGELKARYGADAAEGIVGSLRELGVDLPDQKAGYAIDSGAIEVYSQKHGAALRIERAGAGDIPLPLAYETDASGNAILDKGAKFHVGDAVVKITEPRPAATAAAKTGPIDFVEDLKSRYDSATVRDVVQTLKKLDMPLPDGRDQYAIGKDGISILSFKHNVVAKIVPQENPAASRFLYDMADPAAENLRVGKVFSTGGALIKIEPPLLPDAPKPAALAVGKFLNEPVRTGFPADVDLVPMTPAAMGIAQRLAPDWQLEPLEQEKNAAARKPAPALTSSFQAKAGRATGKADVLTSLAEGNYAGAAVSGGMQLTLSEKTYQSAATLTSAVKPVAAALGQVAKRIPLVGAVVTAGYVAYEVGSHAVNGDMARAGTATVAGAAEIAGNLVGLGVGDGAREVVRSTAIAAGGEKLAVEKSGLRTLGERLADLVGSKFSKPVSSLHDIEEKQKRLIAGDPVFVQTAKVGGKDVPLIEAMREEARNLRYQEQLKKAGGVEGKFRDQIRALDEFRRLEQERKRLLSVREPLPQNPSPPRLPKP